MAKGRGRTKDGRSRKRRTQECGVFILQRNSFCDLPQKRFGRCEFHLAALKTDSTYEMLRTSNAVDRKRILAVLDGVQKIRPRWQFENPEGERILMEAAAQEETAA